MSEIHTPYRVRTKRETDFTVRYEFNVDQELEPFKPYQGMRVDWTYKEDNVDEIGVFMIWPEFLDCDGNVVTGMGSDLIQSSGVANMWIVNDDLRAYHSKRIQVGTQGAWVKGQWKIADVVVCEVGSLKELNIQEEK